MRYHTTTPTFSAGTYDTEVSATIEQVIRGPLDFMKMACPTLQLLMDNSKEFALGPDGKVSWNYLFDMGDTYMMTDNQVFPLPSIDPISRLEYSVQEWGGAMSTNETEIRRYKNQNRSLVDLVFQKQQATNNGLTQGLNYMLFSKWNESIVNSELDIESAMSSSPLPPPTKIKNITVNTQQIYSIPMCIRPSVTGHTFGNVSSANAYWQCREDNGDTPTRSAAGNNIDIVTATPLTAPLGVSDIRDHLVAVQIGAGFRLYCPLPADLYGVLSDFILAERRRDANSDPELVNLGIDSHFVFEEYNTAFYLENMMTWLWANSMFFFDTEALFLVFEEGFNPFISQLERLQHSTVYGSATKFHGNLCAINRTALSAMHGWASE